MLDMAVLAPTLKQKRPLIVGVSGGSDSLALLFLLRSYLQSMGLEDLLYAVTVDHQLRAQSRQEAEEVAQICAVYQIKHHICVWEGDKPQQGLSMQSRMYRYRALYDIAKKCDAAAILVGHTLDDQLETCAMRRKRGIGRGLAGMSVQSVLYDDMPLLRPLLKVKREGLREFLRENHLQWIEDPSNYNILFERPRIRQELKEQPGQIPELMQLLNIYGQQRIKQNQSLVSLLKTAPIFWKNDVLQISYDWLNQQTDKESLDLFFSYLLALVGGRAYFLPLRQVKFFWQQLTNQVKRFNLAGVMIEVQSDKIFIWREQRGLQEERLCSFDTLIWDRRLTWINKSLQDFIIKPVSLVDIKNFFKQQNISLENFFEARIGGLAGLFTLKQELIDIPMLTGGIFLPPTIEMQRCLYPFYFIRRQEDNELYRTLKTLFDKSEQSTNVF